MWLSATYTGYIVKFIINQFTISCSHLQPLVKNLVNPSIEVVFLIRPHIKLYLIWSRAFSTLNPCIKVCWYDRPHIEVRYLVVKNIHNPQIFWSERGDKFKDVLWHSFRCCFFHSGSLCSCPQWLTLDADNRTCIDKDECATPWTCSQKCVNAQKHYYCFCSQGYSLNADKTCQADQGMFLQFPRLTWLSFVK